MTETLTQRLQRAMALRDAANRADLRPRCDIARMDDAGAALARSDAERALRDAAPSIVQLAVELGAEVERLEVQFDQMRVLRKDEGKRLRRIAHQLLTTQKLGALQSDLNELANGLECGNPLGDCGCEGSCFTCGDCDRCNA